LSNELFSTRDPTSTVTTTLDRTYYSVLLSGRPADPSKGTREIPPIFERSFSIERNLQSWAKCGAVPLTRCILQHRSVRHEDEIFVSSDLGENQKDFKKRLSEWTKLKAQKDLELKAKFLLQQQETQPTKKFTSAELVTLLKWKTGKTTQGMKVDELRNSWEIAKLQDSPEDIMLPEQPQPPALPAVNQTALGRTIKRKFNEVIAAVETTADAIDDDDFNTIAEQFNKICERRGVRFANITNTTQV